MTGGVLMHDPAAVRRFLVERLGLARRADLTPVALVRRLEAVQIDPVNLVARNHELVFHNRLQSFMAGQAGYYQGEERIFEYIAGNRALLPLADLPLFVPYMRRREERHRDNLRRLAEAVGHVLREIEAAGPLTSRRIEWAERTHAYWDNERLAPRTKETAFALHLLWEIGRLTVVGRSGAEILYDLAERALPAALLRRGRELTTTEAGRLLRQKYYRAFGVFDAQHQFFGWQHLTAREREKAVEEDARAGLIEPLPVAGVKRAYWALAGTADLLAGQAPEEEAKEMRFLSPLDNLLWRRERLEDLFGFAYRWEIYTPQAKRTGGPYTLPVLHGSDLVGRLDARMDRGASALIVDRLAFVPGVKVGRTLRRKVEEELDRLRDFCGAGMIGREPSSQGQKQQGRVI